MKTGYPIPRWCDTQLAHLKGLNSNPSHGAKYQIWVMYHMKVWIILFSELFTWAFCDTAIKSYRCSKVCSFNSVRHVTGFLRSHHKWCGGGSSTGFALRIQGSCTHEVINLSGPKKPKQQNKARPPLNVKWQLYTRVICCVSLWTAQHHLWFY